MPEVFDKVFSNKRVVVFGCGYLGSSLALYAKKMGSSVVALTRNQKKADLLRQHAIEVVVAELSDTHWHNEISGRFDYAVNCVGSSGDGLNGYEKSYVQGMQSILLWSAFHPITTLVYTSSTSVYPQSDASSVNESADTSLVGERGQILLRAEKFLSDSATKASLIERFFILRLAGIYGPQRHHLLDQVRLGQLSAPLDNYLNLIYRDDAVAAISACFSATPTIKNRIFNCSDNSPVLKRAIIEWLCKELKLSFPSIVEAVQSKRGMGSLNRRINSSYLIETLGWLPKYSPFEEGYRALLRTVG